MKLYCIILLTVTTVLISCNQNETLMKIEYPQTKKVSQVDDYFGTKVSDPYRWLENDTTRETADWVRAENKITFDYLKRIPFREKIRERLKQIWNFPRTSAPFKKSGLYFYYKNDGLQNQSVLYVQKNIEDAATAKVLIDPNTMSAEGTVALGTIAISKDGKHIAYSIARGGSDWNEIFVRNIETGKDIEDHLTWVKFSGISWSEDGFYYSAYEAPKHGTELSKKNEFQKLYFHKLGTPQSKDVLVMENKEEPLRMFAGSVTQDSKYLIVYEETQGKRGNSVWVKELAKNNAAFIHLVNEFDNEYSIFDNDENILFVRTNYNASKYKVIAIDLKNPRKENWKDIIPEGDNLLENCQNAGGKFIVQYMKDAYSKLDVYEKNGKYIRSINIAGIGTISAFNGNNNDDVAFYTFTSYTISGDIFKYHISSGKSELFESSKIKFDGSLYETKQIFYTSKDGCKIPMFITHKKGLVLDGNNPVLLYAYGGFNVKMTPSFNIAYVTWFENGGVYAVANLRGGGEYGVKWHEAGTKLKKQNVFDDYIAAAEYLIKEKYTNPEKLVARGGSNGGLLVGAVINQRPDLFKVALPAVGVMDMLRFHKFTIGWNWVADYGSSDNKEEFEYIYKYSPLHNINETVKYPSVLVTTADHDDRVVPAHSFKYIATLQEKYKGTNPVLVRIETMAGHSAGKSTAKLIDEYTDMWSFVFYKLGVVPDYK